MLEPVCRAIRALSSPLVNWWFPGVNIALAITTAERHRKFSVVTIALAGFSLFFSASRFLKERSFVLAILRIGVGGGCFYFGRNTWPDVYDPAWCRQSDDNAKYAADYVNTMSFDVFLRFVYGHVEEYQIMVEEAEDAAMKQRHLTDKNQVKDDMLLRALDPAASLVFPLYKKIFARLGSPAFCIALDYKFGGTIYEFENDPALDSEKPKTWKAKLDSTFDFWRKILVTENVKWGEFLSLKVSGKPLFSVKNKKIVQERFRMWIDGIKQLRDRPNSVTIASGLSYPSSPKKKSKAVGKDLSDSLRQLKLRSSASVKFFIREPRTESNETSRMKKNKKSFTAVRGVFKDYYGDWLGVAKRGGCRTGGDREVVRGVLKAHGIKRDEDKIKYLLHFQKRRPCSI